MTEKFRSYDSPEDPYKPDFLPPDEHLDPFPEEFQLYTSGPMNEWDKFFQSKIESLVPDDEFLTVEEEKDASVAIQTGLKAGKRLTTPSRLREKDKAELELKVQTGKIARDELIIKNLRLAAWFVRLSMDFNKAQREQSGGKGRNGAIYKDLSKLSGGELDYGDRMQIATIGLIKAAESYEGNCRFSTWAMYAMESELGRAMFKVESPVYIPEQMQQKLRDLEKTYDLLESQLHREPTMNEIAESMGIGELRTVQLEQLSHTKQPISFEEIETLYLEQQKAAHNSEEQISIEDIIGDSGVDKTVFDEVALEEMGYQLDKMLAILPERDQQILEMRFGILTGVPMTLVEIARELGVSRERIRELESRALERLRLKYSTRHRELVTGDDDPMMSKRGELVLGEETEGKLNLTKPNPYHRTNWYRPFWMDTESEPDQEKLPRHPGRAYTLQELRILQEQNKSED